MDVIEIDGASNNSVEQVRQLREDCQYAPASGRFKIYIIDEVHMLSNAAFNALLKTLEEPPSHVKFIFATTESQKVIPTIVSRCQRFEFRPISDEVISAKLVEIAKEEGVGVEQAATRSLARLANGGMRDALSMLDQMISFCGETIAQSDVLDVYGLASPERIEALARGIAQADCGAVVAIVDRLASEGRDLYRALVDLQAFFREVLMRTIRDGESASGLGYPLSNEALIRLLDALQGGESGVKRGLSEKVNFEMALLKAIEASRMRSIDALIKKLTGISGGLPNGEATLKKKIVEKGGTLDARGQLPRDRGAPPAQGSSSAPPAPSREVAGSIPSAELPVSGPGLEDGVSAADGPSKERGGEVEPPGLETLLAYVPESTKRKIVEEFHGEFRSVEKIDPEGLL